MQAALIKRRTRGATIALVVLALGAVLAFALLSGGTRNAQAAVRHAAKHHVAKPHVTHHAAHRSAVGTTDPSGSSDGDNVQSGDQTTPDSTSTAAPGETSGESESSVDSEQGQPGEPANGTGHQDPAGSSGSQCDGNCVN